MTPEAYAQMGRLQASHWWFTARRQILRSQLQRMQLVPDARILEVGCGPGGNLRMLQEFGQVTAVEMDAGARDHAARISGLQIFPGHLPDAMPQLKAFDLIALFDVLEHVADDSAALKALKTMLGPGGKLILTVPAGPWMFGPHDAAHHHQRRYNARQLVRVVKESGWELAHITYFNTWLFPFIAVRRLLAIVMGRRKAGSDMDNLPPRPINRLLHAVFASEATLLRRMRFPFGVSLLCVLHPST